MTNFWYKIIKYPRLCQSFFKLYYKCKSQPWLLFFTQAILQIVCFFLYSLLLVLFSISIVVIFWLLELPWIIICSYGLIICSKYKLWLWLKLLIEIIFQILHFNFILIIEYYIMKWLCCKLFKLKDKFVSMKLLSVQNYCDIP